MFPIPKPKGKFTGIDTERQSLMKGTLAARSKLVCAIPTAVGLVVPRAVFTRAPAVSRFTTGQVNLFDSDQNQIIVRSEWSAALVDLGFAIDNTKAEL